VKRKRATRGRGIGRKVKKAVKWGVPLALAGLIGYKIHNLNKALSAASAAASNEDPVLAMTRMMATTGAKIGKAANQAYQQGTSGPYVAPARGLGRRKRRGGSLLNKVARFTRKYTPGAPIQRWGERRRLAKGRSVPWLQGSGRRRRRNIRGRGAFEAFDDGFSMPFNLVGGLAQMAAPFAPFL